MTSFPLSFIFLNLRNLTSKTIYKFNVQFSSQVNLWTGSKPTVYSDIIRKPHANCKIAMTGASYVTSVTTLHLSRDVNTLTHLFPST